MTVVVLYFIIFIAITVSAGFSLSREFGGTPAKWTSIFASIWVVFGAGVYIWYSK